MAEQIAAHGRIAEPDGVDQVDARRTVEPAELQLDARRTRVPRPGASRGRRRSTSLRSRPAKNTGVA